MSEQWAIALVGIAIGVLGWAVHEVSVQIKGLGAKIDEILNTMVKQSTCNLNMGQHCKRLDQLEKRVDSNCETIAVLKEKHKKD